MFTLLLPVLAMAMSALAAPMPAENAAAATVGQIRAVTSPVFHLYLQANSKNSTLHPLLAF